jgi:hypothetical protein
MSTHINDFKSGAVLAASLGATSIGTDTNGSSVDLGAADGDGPCFAIQNVGSVDDSGTLDGRIEQSADGSSWSAISGVAFTQVTAANDLQVIRFTRTMRYLRWAATITGGSVAFTVAALIGSQKKTF